MNSHELQLVGNPSRNTFPSDTVEDCYSRNVWDLQYYDDRIYVGGGDITRTAGAVAFDIHSLNSAGKLSYHLSTGSQAVYGYHVHENKLIAMARDKMGRPDAGHVIVRDGGFWFEHYDCIPLQNKGGDMAFLDGYLYAIVDYRRKAGERQTHYSFMRSPDIGNTWEVLIENLSPRRFTGMVPYQGFLLIFGTYNWKPCLFTYRDGELSALETPDPARGTDYPMEPGRRHVYTYNRAYLRLPFLDGVVYAPIVKNSYLRNTGLLFLDNLETGARWVKFFSDKQVRDFIVRDDVLYVLTNESLSDSTKPGCEWQATVYASSNLSTWDRVFESSFYGLPYSLEELRGDYYIGLGNRSKTIAHGGPFADPESGNIYRVCMVEPEPEKKTFTIHKDGLEITVDVSVKAIEESKRNE